VRPTTPPAAPQGHSTGTEGGRREALRRRILTLHALGHWQIGMPHVKTTQSARTPPSRGTLATWTGGQRAAVFPRPGQTGPLPRRKSHPVYTLKRLNTFESTPEDAPRLPIQSNNRTSSELHTHVMSRSARRTRPPPSCTSAARVRSARPFSYAAEPCCAVEWRMACATAFLSALVRELASLSRKVVNELRRSLGAKGTPSAWLVGLA